MTKEETKKYIEEKYGRKYDVTWYSDPREEYVALDNEDVGITLYPDKVSFFEGDPRHIEFPYTEEEKIKEYIDHVVLCDLPLPHMLIVTLYSDDREEIRRIEREVKEKYKDNICSCTSSLDFGGEADPE